MRLSQGNKLSRNPFNKWRPILCRHGHVGMVALESLVDPPCDKGGSTRHIPAGRFCHSSLRLRRPEGCSYRCSTQSRRARRSRSQRRLRLNRDNRKWPAPIIMEWARIVLRSRGFLFACRCRAGVRPGLMPDSLVPHISAPVDAPFPRAPIGWCFQEGIGARIAKVWSLCQEKGCQFGILSETLVPAATRAL
jgi:hypothetical protein